MASWVSATKRLVDLMTSDFPRGSRFVAARLVENSSSSNLHRQKRTYVIIKYVDRY